MASIGDENAGCAPASPPAGEHRLTRLQKQIEQKQIDDLEQRAADIAVIATRATDPEARLYNASLARELRELSARLRSQLS